MRFTKKNRASIAFGLEWKSSLARHRERVLIPKADLWKDVVPPELEEAARVEGASRWYFFRRVTFPLLMPTTLFVFVNAVINSFKLVDHLFILRSRVDTFSTQGNRVRQVPSWNGIL